MQHTFTMNEHKATLVFNVVKSHIAALKNWTASAVETGDIEKAQGLVNDLREYEKLFAAFNIHAKHEIAEYTGKPVKTDHVIS